MTREQLKAAIAKAIQGMGAIHEVYPEEIINIFHRAGIPVDCLLDGRMVAVLRTDAPFIEYGKRTAEIIAAKPARYPLAIDGTIAGAAPTNPEE